MSVEIFEIATPSLVEFSKQLVEKTKEGWVLDVDSVQHCPVQIANLYTVVLKKNSDSNPTAPDTEVKQTRRQPPVKKASV